MGISPSKKLKQTLTTSPTFTTACESSFTHCLSLTQHAFPGLLPYQLSTASSHIHTTLSSTPLFLHWLPHPPSHSQIHSALYAVTKTHEVDHIILEWEQFKEWAVLVFSESVVENVKMKVVRSLPVGVVGIVGVGSVVKSGKGVLGAIVGAYVVAVFTSVFVSLSASGL